MKFFYPDGTEIKSVAEFVEIYNYNYYTDCTQKLRERYGNSYERYAVQNGNISKNVRHFEDDIDTILTKGFLSDEAKTILAKYEISIADTIIKAAGNAVSDRIMIYTCFAWKTQKVKASCEDIIRLTFDNRCVFSEENDCVLPNDRGRLMLLDDSFFNNVKSAVKTQNIVDAIREFLRVKYLGATYAVALWFFVTKGMMPIYDVFAAKALYAVSDPNGKAPGEHIASPTFEINYYGNNEETYNHKIRELLTNNGSKYQEYIRSLTEIFGNEWQTNRDIDRALWVYGHLFPDA